MYVFIYVFIKKYINIMGNSHCTCHLKIDNSKKIKEMETRINYLKNDIAESLDISDGLNIASKTCDILGMERISKCITMIDKTITKNNDLMDKNSMFEKSDNIYEKSNGIYEKKCGILEMSKSLVKNNPAVKCGMIMMKSETISSNLYEIQYLESKIGLLKSGSCLHCATMQSIELNSL